MTHTLHVGYACNYSVIMDGYYVHSIETEISKRRPVNLTIREDLMQNAKSLNLNTSKAAEAGIEDAIKKIQTVNGWNQTKKLY
ncbi:type II toxin-antitoxin system CcdA family antitoxin [Nitrosomonas supralitoralis]|uniref:Post-segregation antitoxin CcdA n=1 Tax=Nitrosomonas supralitoralis TaxID=2116706 RepID=A0A2P7NQG8_9PROT|nr:type II toxin-antitoxin system CcdA family antitoxin [Nitrosomonas supralitoralis]PSJ15721.1 hypothetical protein C7H79_17455 [Nitrosomonas supralitoralis]